MGYQFSLPMVLRWHAEAPVLIKESETTNMFVIIYFTYR